MATIRPFRGIRYRVPDLSQVMSQPYDRIQYGLQERYYQQSPYNVVRIIQGKALPTDLPERPEGPNVYTRARSYIELWQAEGILARETQPALYVYHQTFTVDGQTRTRKNVIAALQLSEFGQGIVLPHERTHAGPKLDRLRLLRTLQANTGQIFVLYPDPQNRVTSILDAAIASQEPDIDLVEMFEKDVRQQVWVVTDPAVIRAVQDEMEPKRNLIIADGHHRYETALNYRQEMRAAHPDAPLDSTFNYCMVSMVSMDDPGLIVLATHREIVNNPRVPGAEVLARAAQTFRITPADSLEACIGQMREHAQEHAFGFYDRRYYVLVLQDPACIDAYSPAGRAWAWKSLDVSILENILLERVIGLTADDIDSQSHINYHRDPMQAIDSVNRGEGDYLFLLNPTRIDQIKACVQEGEKMPQKSTDFYPKMITGLTMMPVDVREQI
jgi:uncharacterized protein (DUF1015 family)